MAGRAPNQYLVAELKDLLTERDLPTVGLKADMINRLTEFNPNIWLELDEARQAALAQGGAAAADNDDEPQAGGENARLLPRNDGNDDADPSVQRELELLRRERDVARRELELLRAERGVARSVDRDGHDTRASYMSSGSASMSIRAISELLSDFDGRDSSFENWKRQLELLRNSYDLDENTTRVLISTKLKGRALSWFHSKPDYLTETIPGLLSEMAAMFDSRPQKISLRKEFETRVWQTKESFADYYYNKIILANRVPIGSDEIVDYLIDGIPDDRLKNQARMMRFREMSDVLEAFKKITLDPGKVVDREKSLRVTKSFPENARKNIATAKARKCYNCYEIGHLANKCTKPKRYAGAGFVCNSAEHRVKDCPLRASNQREPASGASAPSLNASTANVLQAARPSEPYMVTLTYAFSDCIGNVCKQTLSAIVDPGSPISLIKNCCVPAYLRTAVSDDVQFFGINLSRLEILGVFERDIVVDGISVKIKFHIVADDAIAFMALLGRDFSRHPSIRVTLDDKVVISRRENLPVENDELKSTLRQILNIEYVEKPVKVNDDLYINPTISEDVKSKVKGMFNACYLDLRRAARSEPEFEMRIALTHQQPISFRPRRLSFADKEALRVILDDLLSRTIIQPSNSPYASPIVLSRKKSGDLRLCIDFRELNKITVRDNFPSELIDDNLDRLKDKHYFTSLDLKDGFFHVKIEKDSVKYTSFVTPLGQFEFLRCPFGLTNAPKVFSRFLYEVFGKLLREQKILLFSDDILIATADLKEHLDILSEVFECAGRFHLNFRLDKCKFLMRELDYLGYFVSAEGIRPSEHNVRAVIDYPVPRNQKEVLRFTCLASYFRRFIPNFAIKAKPLHDLVKKGAVFKFGADEYEAFAALKECLSSRPLLSVYSPKAQNELHCDASASGFGAILLQKQSDGHFRPVSYFSQRTTPAESKYHSFELECLAVVNALKRYKLYLSGIKFKIITDCDSFRLTLSKQEINPRISRWAMFLQNFDYEIQHRPGKRMTHVDALSRCHSVSVVEANTLEQTLSLCQYRDPKIQKIRETLEKTESPFFELFNGLIYRKDQSKKLLFYVPREMETNVIRTCHDDLGHLGLDKVVCNLNKVYWFPEMRAKMKQHIANCLRCIEFSQPSGKREGYLHGIAKGNLPFQTVHIDHLGPFEKSTQNNKYILVIVDAFTKFLKLYACKSTKSSETIKRLKDYFRAYSRPMRLISDRGTAFTSAEFKQFLEAEKIEHVLVAVGTPRANGQVERYNRVITPALAKLTDNPKKWDREIERVEFAINNTVCRVTGETPSRLLFGVEQYGKADDCMKIMIENITNDDTVRDLCKIRESASEKIKSSQLSNEKLYNDKRKEAKLYSVGDYVMIRNVDTSVGVNKKLLPKFRGPYVVKKVLDFDRYVIGDVDGFQVTQMPYTGVLSPDHMRPYVMSTVE